MPLGFHPTLSPLDGDVLYSDRHDGEKFGDVHGLMEIRVGELREPEYE